MILLIQFFLSKSFLLLRRLPDLSLSNESESSGGRTGVWRNIVIHYSPYPKGLILTQQAIILSSGILSPNAKINNLYYQFISNQCIIKVLLCKSNILQRNSYIIIRAKFPSVRLVIEVGQIRRSQIILENDSHALLHLYYNRLRHRYQIGKLIEFLVLDRFRRIAGLLLLYSNRRKTNSFNKHSVWEGLLLPSNSGTDLLGRSAIYSESPQQVEQARDLSPSSEIAGIGGIAPKVLILRTKRLRCVLIDSKAFERVELSDYYDA